MQQTTANSPVRIDLSDKTPDQIAEYLQALLSIRYEFHRNGLKLKIDRRLSPPKILLRSTLKPK